MDDVVWFGVYYPAVITIYAVLCQSRLYVPQDTPHQHHHHHHYHHHYHHHPAAGPFEAGRRSILAEDVRTVIHEQKDVPNDPAQFESKHHTPLTTVHSRSTIWWAAFWLTLQCYCLIRMGTKIRPAEQQQAGFIWPAMIILCIPTFLTLASIGDLHEALESVESYQESSIEPKQEYFLTANGVVAVSWLWLVPWIQAILVLVWS